MKTKILVSIILSVFLSSGISSCKKRKDPEPAPVTTPPPPAHEEEVITTFKLLLTDSASGSVFTYMFKDPDGDGGQPAFYGPDSNSQTDSVINLGANKTYYSEILLLDETKSPVDTISREVNEEGDEHMFFYNNGANTIVSSSNPYTVKLNGSDIIISYTDLDSGNPQRGIGLKTKWKTAAGTGSAKNPLNVTLKHQPGTKDGTYAPGESDISVDFKIIIQ